MVSPLGLLPLPRHPSVGCLSPVDHGHGWSALLLTLLLGGHFLSATDGAAPIRAAGRVDLLTGVPLLLREFASAATRPRIGLVLSGSDRLDGADDLAARLGAPVYDAYGSTEAGTLCLASPEDRRRSPAPSAGPSRGCGSASATGFSRPAPRCSATPCSGATVAPSATDSCTSPDGRTGAS
ncbi:AMP-binding protein [Tessaracoccus aquimaris]|uniref:AMP-binding protein n=1 Tax=Tessaracoccus aquimaris TaxID=1332264 RepID=UPI002FF56F08